MATTARAPAATASPTVATNAVAGTHSTTRSTGWPSPSRACASEAYVGWPSTSVPPLFTRATGRPELDASARLLRMCPHLAGSLLAPTTAIERGSKSAVRAASDALSGDP